MDKLTEKLNQLDKVDTAELILTEPEVKKMAHLPFLTFFYLFFQKKLSATPVTALELAAYLGIEIHTSEKILSFLEKGGFVKVFKEDMEAYLLAKDLDEINLQDLVHLLGEFHKLTKKQEQRSTSLVDSSSEKYRKLYSELAGELLQIFSQETANRLPV